MAQNVNVTRFARNVEWDIFCDFPTLCWPLILSHTCKQRSCCEKLNTLDAFLVRYCNTCVVASKLMCHCILKYRRISNWKRQAQTLLSMRTKMLRWFAMPLVNPNPPSFGREKMENHFMSKGIRKWVIKLSAIFGSEVAWVSTVILALFCSFRFFWRISGTASCQEKRYGSFYVHCQKWCSTYRQ